MLCGAYFSPLQAVYFGQTANKRQTSVVIILCNCQQTVRDGVIEENPKCHRKPQQINKLDRRLRSICTKLDQGNVKAGIRVAVGDVKVADFTVDNYAVLKRNLRETCFVSDPTDIAGF